MGQSRLIDRWPSLRQADYAPALARMQAYTQSRDNDAPDVFWAVEHTPVYTLGVAGRDAHIRDSGAIPIVRSDRGGQVTYHGPGQVVLYTLLDLRRLGLSIRCLVNSLEQATINMLHALGLHGAQRLEGAPGVYVPAQRNAANRIGAASPIRLTAPGPEALKIASLGLKVRRGCCYHGIALNNRLSDGVFSGIDPCGYPGLGTTDLFRQGILLDWEATADMLFHHLIDQLYSSVPSRP